MKLNHFIIYYIEPLVNLPLYKPGVTMDDIHEHVRGFKPGANACMFEYLMLSRSSKKPIEKGKYQDPELPAKRGKKVVHSTISPDRERTTRAPKKAHVAAPPSSYIRSSEAPYRKSNLFYFSTKKPEAKKKLLVYSTTKPRGHPTAPPMEPAKQIVYSTTGPPAKTTPLTIIRSTPPSGEDDMKTIIRSSTPGAKPVTTPLPIIHSSEVPEKIGDTIIHSTTVRPTGGKPSTLPIIHSTTKRSNKTPLPIIHSTTKKTSQGQPKNFGKKMMGRSLGDMVVVEKEEDDAPEEPSSPYDHAPSPPRDTEPHAPKTASPPPSTSPASTAESTRNTIIYSSTKVPDTTTVTTATVPMTVTADVTTTVTTVPVVSTDGPFIHSTKTPAQTEKPILISSRVPERKASAPFISTLAPKRVSHPHPTPPPSAFSAEASTESTATASFIISSIAPEKVPRPPFFMSTPKPPSAERKIAFKSTRAPKKVAPRKFISSTVSTADKVTKPRTTSVHAQPIQDAQPQPQVQKGEVFEEKRVKYTTVKVSMVELPPPPPPPTTHHYLSTAATRAARRRRRRAITYADIDENDIYASTFKPDEDFGEELFERPRKTRRSRTKRDLDDDVDDEWEHEHIHEDPKSDEEVLDDDDDMIEEVMYPKGNKAPSKVEVFDLYRAQSLLCNLCIWLQPEFAFKFGFQHGIHLGAAEMIDLVRYMNWIFRPMDFNMDYRPENIGFRVRKVMVVDIPEVDQIPQEDWQQDARKLMPLIKRAVSDKFPDKCCAILAYVYRNMDPFGSLSSRSSFRKKYNNF